MANKKKNKQIDRRVFKKEGEELQQWLAFRKRGSRVESGKAYNRQKMKRGDREWELSVPTAEVPLSLSWSTLTIIVTPPARSMGMNVVAVVGSKLSSNVQVSIFWKKMDKKAWQIRKPMI